jgi:hypothetical protein
MLPDNVPATTALPGPYLDPQKGPRDFLVAYEMGGRALSDPSAGLRVKLWTLQVVNTDTGQDVQVSAPGVPAIVLFSSAAGITEADLAFDQNMKPAVAYVEAGVAKLWWYDTTVPGQVVLNLPAGSTSPRCTLDDKRRNQVSVSDIVVFYMLGGNVCYRQQRERFTVERTMGTAGADAVLVSVGMNRELRLQWRIQKFTAPIDDSKYASIADPYLGDVVLDLCRRAGLGAANIDVSELYEQNVAGYLVATDGDSNSSLKPLSDVFFFDPTEFDRVLHFFRRGRQPVGRFTYADLVQGDPQPMPLTIADATKLPLKVNVSHIDPDGAFARNKQYAQRKSNQITTKKEVTVETDVVLTPNQAAQAAVTLLKQPWHEQLSFEKFGLPMRFSAWVPGDVVEYEAEDGTVYRLRLTSRNQDANLVFSAQQDAGDLAYNNGHITGHSLPPPISTTPGLIGETQLEVLNIPVLRDQDDEVGVYIAMAGDSSAWYGAQLLISTDGGVNYLEAYRTEQPATLGVTESTLLEELSAEYQDSQSLLVHVNFPLESTTPDALLNNYNRAVVGDEVIQFQTATHLGDNHYALTGLIRARYNTKPVEWPIGTRFVLLDSTVSFVQAQQWMLGLDLMFKPVSFGTLEDDTVPTEYTFDEAVSQTEWPPHYVTATRDGADAVQVDFIPRPRLGVETAPHQSKYFTGYRVRFSDGFTADTAATTYTRASTPTGVTVAVCAVNSITGDGEYSTETPT